MKTQYYIVAALLFVVAVVIAIFSYNTVWLGDDINYAYDFRPGHNEEIVSSLAQVLSSLNEHYMTVNGRYVPHVFVQLFCGIWGHAVFAVANALFYIIFIIALCRLSHVALYNIAGVFSVVIFSLIVFQTKMVPSCQIGYIWTFSLVMIFLIYFFSGKSYSKWWKIMLLGLLSLVAGNGNEALTLGVSGALIIYWCFNMRNMTRTQYVMMICFGVGTLAICLSPGAYSRVSTSTTGALSIVGLYKSFTGFFLTVKSSFVMWAVIIWQKFHRKIDIKHIYIENSFYFNVWLIMIVFNALIGFSANRQVFGAELMAVVITIRLLKNHSFNKLWMALGGVVLVVLYIAQFQMVFKIKSYYDDIVSQYSRAQNGIVYADVDQSNKVPYSMNFSPTLPLYGIGDTELYEHSRFAKYLKTMFPNNAEVRILPNFMQEGRKFEKSELIPLQPGLFLAIVSEKDGKKVFVDRSIDNMFMHTKWEPEEIDMTYRTLCEGADWKARYVSIGDYTILGLTDNTVYLK